MVPVCSRRTTLYSKQPSPTLATPAGMDVTPLRQRDVKLCASMRRRLAGRERFFRPLQALSSPTETTPSGTISVSGQVIRPREAMRTKGVPSTSTGRRSEVAGGRVFATFFANAAGEASPVPSAMLAAARAKVWETLGGAGGPATSKAPRSSKSYQQSWSVTTPGPAKRTPRRRRMSNMGASCGHSHKAPSHSFDAIRVSSCPHSTTSGTLSHFARASVSTRTTPWGMRTRLP